MGVEPEPLAGDLETLADEIGKFPLSAHPRMKTGLVVASAADLPDDAHQVRGAQRIVDSEPIAKEGGDLERKAQHRPCRVARADGSRRLDNRLEVAIGE